MQQYVWYFWEGEKPVHIQLCERTIERHCYNCDVIQIDMSNISEYLDIDVSYFNNLSLPNMSDIISYMLLYKHGGIWLDLDNIMLKSIDPIVELIKQYECIGYMRTTTNKKGDRLPGHSFMASPPGTDLMLKVITKCDEYVHREQNNLSYEHYLDIFGELFNNSDDVHVLPTVMFEPINWVKKSRKDFLRRKSTFRIDISETYCVHMFNNLLKNELQGISEDDLLHSGTVLSYLFNVGLS